MRLLSQSVITTDGISLMAYTAGDKTKPAVVFVHGYPDNHQLLKKLMSYFVDEYYLVAYDVRGAGASDKPKRAKSYKLPQLADDLWAVTAQVLGDKPFHVVAHDWGSVQTWESACQVRFTNKMLSFTSMSGPCLAHMAKITSNPHIAKTVKIKQIFASWYVYMLHLPVVPKIFWKNLAPKWHRITKLPNNPSQYSDAVYGRLLYQANIIPEQIKAYKNTQKNKAVCPIYLPIFTKDEFVMPVLLSGIDELADELTKEEMPLSHWSVYHDAEFLSVKIKNFITGFSRTC